MGIFVQNIDNSVYNTLVSDQKSEFWESWVRPTFSLGALSVIEFEMHDEGLLHLKMKKKGVTLGGGNIYLYSENFPNKYFSFIHGVDFSSSTIGLMGKGKPLLVDEFNTIRCRYVHVRHIPILKGFNIRAKMNCQLYDTREVYDTYFGSDVEFEGKCMPVLADIFDISGILVKSITVQFREYFKGQIKFTKCNGISKSNIEGWDALYSTEL